MLFMIISAISSYLIGSINPAVIISKKLYGKDIRTLGSNNAGATNAYRSLGKKAGAIIFFLDFSKGLIAVAGAKCLLLLFDASYECMLIAGFFAQLGHTFPVFFRFKGGKGVATAAGSAFAIMPPVAAILLTLFAVIVVLTKTVSLASSICAALYPLLAYFLTDSVQQLHFIFAASCAVMITVKHASNIARLLDGEEKKITSK